MVSEFSFIIFKISIVSKRLSVLSGANSDCELTAREILSLSEYRKYLIERAITIMIVMPYVKLAKSFFIENEMLHYDDVLRNENAAIFAQISQQAVIKAMKN